MKNTFKLLLAGIVGGLTAFFIYQGIYIFINHKNIAKIPETIHEIRIGENISISEIIEKNSPAIIQIINTKKNIGEFNFNIAGSGVIIDNINGYAVTNYHIINNNEDLLVNLSDGRTTKAKRLGGDPDYDLAVIQLEDKSKLKVIPLGDSLKTKIGQTSIAIGASLDGEFKNTVTIGIINALNRKIYINNSNRKTILTMLQTDAIINSGNTGGALINSAGELIGITTIKIDKTGFEGLGFAIPSHVVKSLADEIIKTGKVTRITLGIDKLIELTPSLAKHYNVASGIYIGDILENSSAAYAGIQKKDILVKIDDKKINTFEQFKQNLYSHITGDSINVNVFRNNKSITLNLILQ